MIRSGHMDGKSFETARLMITLMTEAHLTKRYREWLHDPVVRQYSDLGQSIPTLSESRKYWELFEDSPHYFWAIEMKDHAPAFVGTMTAFIDKSNRVADLGIMIGEKSVWGQGIGSEAWCAACDYLFREGDIRKITAGTIAHNKGMLGIMQKVGMAEDGIQRKQLLHKGEPTDVIYMAFFRDDFLSQNRERVRVIEQKR